MTARNSIFTHAAVFAAGAALAMVASQPNQTPSAAGADAASNRNPSAHPGESAGSGEDARSAARRERQDVSTSAGRTKEATAQRLANIVKIGDDMERQSALMEFINRLGPGEFAAVAEQFRDLDHFGNSRGEFDLILRGWAKADPLAALEYTAKQPNNGADTAVILATWAGNDAAAAERWALDHHEGDGPNPHLAAVIRGIALYDIAHASRLVESMPSSRERGEAVDAITRALLMQGADAAMAYPASIQDLQLRAGFVAAIADRIASKDPDKAAAWLTSVGEVESQTAAAREVAEALAKQDPASAATWLRKLQPAAQAEAARGIIPVMSSTDIGGTAQWVSTLAGMPNYDRVVEEFVWSCDYRDPEQSAAWIQGVADPDQRARLYHRMLGEWAKRDAEAVKLWVANNSVPASVSKRFIR
jgi:hypothetical protein